MTLTPRSSVAVILAAISFVSFWYSLTTFRVHRGELVIQVADFMQELALPYKVLKLSALSPDTELPVPVEGVRARDIDDSWGALREGGRTHTGVDIFAIRGTPVYAAAHGFVLRKGQSSLGGNYVYTVGAGGRRYYYAHLESFAKGVEPGLPVTTDTVVGFVGNTGNAINTPTHLHFAIYVPQEGPLNPFAFLVDRGN